jgi:hypothetical protein
MHRGNSSRMCGIVKRPAPPGAGQRGLAMVKKLCRQAATRLETSGRMVMPADDCGQCAPIAILHGLLQHSSSLGAVECFVVAQRLGRLTGQDPRGCVARTFGHGLFGQAYENIVVAVENFLQQAQSVGQAVFAQ